MPKLIAVYQKVLSVSFGKLLLILFFRILRLWTDNIEKIWLRLHKECYITHSLFNKPLLQILSQLETYYKSCVFEDSIIDQSDNILEGKVFLFGKKFNISSNSWLRDPLTNNQWSSNIYFAEAKVEEKSLGDVKYVMELNKLYHLVTLAQAYNKTKEQKYIDAIEKQLISWKNNVKYERSVVNKSMLDIVYRCYNLIHVSMLCYENKEFKANVFPSIIEILLLSERQIRKFSTPRWCKYSTGGNHTIGEMAGLVTIQQFLQYFTNKNFDKFLKTEYRYLHRSLNAIITKHGVYLEQSANYAKLVTEFLIMLDIFVKAIGTDICRELYLEEYLKKLLNYSSTLSFTGKFPNFGDNDGAKATTPFYKSFDSVDHLNKYRKLRFPDISVKSYLLCKESGQFIWKSPDENFYLFTRCGKHSFLPLGSGSHAHNDLLGICVGIKGIELFIDYGNLFYNSGLDIINQDRSTAVHNTLSISCVEQAVFAGKWLYGSYPKATIDLKNTKINNREFKFVGCCEYEDRIHTRKICYVDFTLIMTDIVQCKNEDQVSLHFLLAPNVTTQLNDDHIDFYVEGQMIAAMTYNNIMDAHEDKIGYHPSYGMTNETTLITLTSRKRGAQEIKTIINIER